MKVNNKHILFSLIVVGILIMALVALPSVINKNQNNETAVFYYSDPVVFLDTLPVTEVCLLYVFDIEDPELLVGWHDYVFIAEVEKISTSYKWPVKSVDKYGRKVELTDPYTNYYVSVIENIKGELVFDQTIVIQKFGGLAQDQKTFVMAEGDFFPKEGDICIFFGSGQPDGTLLTGGRNTVILLKSEIISEDPAYQIYKKANETQRLPFLMTGNERFISIYDVNYDVNAKED